MAKLLTLVVSLLCTAPIPGLAQEPATFAYQGVDRRYVLHQPSGQSGPRPVVIGLHGLNEPVEAFRHSWTMDAVADSDGLDVVYPAALSGRWAYADTRPVPLPGDNGLVDDVGFINALLDKLIADHVADPSRIYVAGASNGGLMAWTLACRMPERLAAIAPMISGMIERQAQQCHPARLAPLLVLAGTDDLFQSYDGAMAPEFRLMSVPETLEFWRRLRDCTGLKLRRLPAHDPSDPTAAVLVEWTECKDPSPQRFFRIEGGGHSLPSFAPLAERERAPHGGRSQTVETAEELWSFFKPLSLPAERPR
ncbi:MAG: hypothetical protein JO001_19400 [Alphaproteobacteria bacterium]|nr:hypothetical protein [Alphaproteobacteria bacterium]